MNNIFKFATRELSQDAFICWFFNWFRGGDNPRLKQLVIEFCKDKLGIPNVSSVDIHRQFSRNVKKEETSFSVKIDVLIIINNAIAVIIEDKTFTSEHSNQILRYEEGLRILQKQDSEGKFRIEDKAYDISKIMTVYWKMGFFYDCDKCVEADKKIDADYLVELLREYRTENVIIDMFVQKILDDKQWYKDHTKYWDLDNNNDVESFVNTNLYKHQIAQYTMMREIFPAEEMWNGRDLFYVEHGSSYGRPWTELWVYCNRRSKDPEGDKRFEIFWRIDADNKGNYISLRLYKPQKGKWDSKYEDIKHQIRYFIENEGSLSWNDVDPGKKDSYKEADIAHFKIDKELWETKGEHLIKIIRSLTSDIVEFVQKKYGPNAYEIF